MVLINTRVPKPWEGVVNQILAQVAVAHPQIKLVDWYAASRAMMVFTPMGFISDRKVSKPIPRYSQTPFLNNLNPDLR